MKHHVLTVLLATIFGTAGAQSLEGTWQLTDEKTCFKSELSESDTEKELLQDMGGSRNAVARIIRFNKKGGGEESIFSTGRKRGNELSEFKYKLSGRDLMLLDKKSGMMTQQFVVDEFTSSTLKIHNAKKDCEIKTFIKIK
ncbi:MAG: hypothetical protein K2U26_18980 [Cyclobacteriaceae bacterium]|nr:hypothetical protein [Cyclobacteriaceae bacterium]